MPSMSPSCCREPHTCLTTLAGPLDNSTRDQANVEFFYLLRCPTILLPFHSDDHPPYLLRRLPLVICHLCLVHSALVHLSVVIVSLIRCLLRSDVVHYRFKP